MKKGLNIQTLLIFLTATGVVAGLLAGCSNKVAFNALPQGADNSGSSVTDPGSGGGSGPGSGSGTVPPPASGGCKLENVNRPVKVMFVVDTSGSNVSPTMDDGTVACTLTTGCAPATDPMKTFRSGSITTFFNEYQAKTNFSWGFEVFQGETAQSYITSGSNASFGNGTSMQSAITDFNAESDADATPYLAALDNVQAAISTDPDLNSATPALPLYFIVFMSDGYPTDALSSDDPVTVDINALDSAISSIVALAPGRVTLSSVYYGTINDPNAAATLENMASIGKGQFVNVDTGSTSSIVIDDLITVPVGDCN